MKARLYRSFAVSIEWRIFAFIITNLFLWATTHEFWSATWLALELQLILLVANFCWFFFRQEGGFARKLEGAE